MPTRPPTDTRRFRRQTENRLVVLVILCLLVLGSGLIAILYGPRSLVGAVPCLLMGATAIVAPYLALVALERWVNRS